VLPDGAPHIVRAIPIADATFPSAAHPRFPVAPNTFLIPLLLPRNTSPKATRLVIPLCLPARLPYDHGAGEHLSGFCNI